MSILYRRLSGSLPVDPSLHRTPRFCSMVDKFWNDPKSIEVSWLASFLMVLALGSFAVTREPDPTAEFCMAAEACLSKTPFMALPDISTIRTLCLIVLAKQTVNATCQTFDSCWALLGIVMRAAVGMDLNRQAEPQSQSVEALRERQSGRMLWMSIVYFLHTYGHNHGEAATHIRPRHRSCAWRAGTERGGGRPMDDIP